MNNILNEKNSEMFDDLKSIIKASRLEDNNKKIFEKLFDKLSEYQNQELKFISDKVYNHIKEKEYYNLNYSSDNYYKIFTALISKNRQNDAENAGLLPICGVEKNNCGVFINCTRTKFFEVCGKNSYKAIINEFGKIREVKCKLVPDDRYIWAERILFRLAEQYKIKTPVIYSPFARKYAKIVFDCEDNVIADKIDSIELNIDEISESQIYSTFDFVYMWNVHIRDDRRNNVNEIPKASRYISPYFNELKYIFCYENIGSNAYVVSESDDAYKTISINRNDSTINIYSLDKNDFDKRYIEIERISDDISNEFCCKYNYYSVNMYDLLRIRTFADVQYVINCFNENPYDVELSVDEKSFGKSDIFQRESTYYNRISYREVYKNAERSLDLYTTIKCNIYFECKDIIVADDYKDYVLSFLNERYPEFIWNGVIR